jgi:hypothetical protein
MRASRCRPLVYLTEPPCREEVPGECLKNVERKKVLESMYGGACRSRANVHLTNPEDENRKGGYEEKDSTNTASSDWENGPKD